MKETDERLLLAWRQQIDIKLSALAEAKGPDVLYQPMRYILDGGGKRIRPILLLLSCHAVGGDVEKAFDAALAIEMLHNFTLVHDDIMDEDDTRRGRATVHKKWNPAIAILAGDGLFALSYRALLRTRSARIQEITEIFTDGVLGVCEGQALDLAFENQDEVLLGDYVTMIRQKTACLLRTSAQLGALIGDGTDDEVGSLARFAENLGMAFQIQDDLLDITSDEVTLGKTHGSDVKQRKQTYLLVHAWAHASPNEKLMLKQLISGNENSAETIASVKKIFENIGTFQAAHETVEKYFNTARQNLESVRSPEGRRGLLGLLNYIAARKA